MHLWDGQHSYVQHVAIQNLASTCKCPTVSLAVAMDSRLELLSMSISLLQTVHLTDLDNVPVFR